MKPISPQPMTFDEVCRRAGGRRRYHAERARVRNRRQLVVMAVLLKLNWKSYGYGGRLADALSVDRATISRDIGYLVKWRKSFLEVGKMTDEFADAVIARLIKAQIHPRHGFTWTYRINYGFPSLTVRRGVR